VFFFIKDNVIRGVLDVKCLFDIIIIKLIHLIL